MLDGVHLRRVHDGLPVGGGHPQVKGRDGGVPVVIDAGDVDAGLQQEMIDGEAGDFFEFQKGLLYIEFLCGMLILMSYSPRENCDSPIYAVSRRSFTRVMALYRLIVFYFNRDKKRKQ